MNGLVSVMLAASALMVALAILLVVAIAAVWLFQRRPAEEGPRHICFVRAWRPLNNDEIAMALRGWDESDPRWRGIWDLLQREFEANLATLSDTKTEPHELARAAGRFDELLFLRRQILTFRGKEPEE